MSEKRIVGVDRGIGAAGRSLSARKSELGAALASPLGIILVVPLLVCFVGVTLTLVGQNALRESNLAMARDRFGEQIGFVGERIEYALEQAEPTLNQMGDVTEPEDGNEPPVAFARRVRDLMHGRAGMTQAYAGFPDGAYQGVYVGEDGALHFQMSRVAEGGTRMRHYGFVGTGLAFEHEEVNDYDPRKRTWYRDAERARRRIWTEPYPFYTGHRTGITRTQPLVDANGKIHAVIAIDFDVDALSTFMARGELSDVNALVFGQNGVLLAYPRGRARIATLASADRTVTYKDLGDPLLDAFFAHLSTNRADLRNGFSGFDVGGKRVLAAVAPLGKSTGLGWTVAALVPEELFLRSLRSHQRDSLVVGGVALLLAMLSAWIFARHIVRARREVAEARAEAETAKREARELGSYTLVKCLGKGGMGEVWRAQHRLLARQAAIKLISTDLDANLNQAELQERFKREAQTIAGLRSRNTVELYDYGVTDDGTLFYVMELLDGIDLDTLVVKHGPQPAARVISLLAQACNSLAEAHDAGLVHRDIKPANLFTCRAADECDVIKVLDFGLVHSGAAPALGPVSGIQLSEASPGASPEASPDSNKLTAVGAYLGTPGFMAPEQALGHAIDSRSDLYSLACVGWWLLTGRMVFEEKQTVPLLMAHIQAEPPSLRAQVRGWFPPELEALLLECLRKDPEQRPPDARVMATRLRAIAVPDGEAWTETRTQMWWRETSPTPSQQALGATVLSQNAG